ncbi:uncharacterized protein LOC125540545 isoform X2 [Triticum urartu]|uniref:uncharacterized protein LOC125540545 isoform X2 n=1 Tax=Triticum urartu TaxID=4572 RepID=UPI002043A03A|nr:uncharacterized protein LOC125540545 isoform X2 [Triticum urartu]
MLPGAALSRLEAMFKEESTMHKKVNQDVNRLHNELMTDTLVDDPGEKSKNRVHQPLPIIGMVAIGKTTLLMCACRDFDPDRMFLKTYGKAILRSIFNRVRQQCLNECFASYQSIRRNIKNTIDFMLRIDKEKIIWKKGIDMDIMWCIVDTLAEQYKHSQFSAGPDIHHSTSNPFICVKRCTSVRRKPVQKPLFTKSLGTEGVNFSVTDSSLQKGADVSGRTRCPEVDTSFCSPSCELDLHRVCSMDGFNLLLGLYRVDPICVFNGHSILALVTLLSLVSDCSKATVNTRHYRIRKSRQNKGCRVVSRQCLAQKTQNHKRGDTRAAFQKNRRLASRSEPVAADNSSLLTPDSTPERPWRVASAAPQHMTGYLKYLIDYMPASGDQFIDTPTMGHMPFHGRGSVNTTNMTLRDVLYVPGLEANLVSTGQLAELGYTISIGPYGCRVYKDDEGMDLVGKAHYVDGHLLELDFLRV